MRHPYHNYFVRYSPDSALSPCRNSRLLFGGLALSCLLIHCQQQETGPPKRDQWAYPEPVTKTLPACSGTSSGDSSNAQALCSPALDSRSNPSMGEDALMNWDEEPRSLLDRSEARSTHYMPLQMASKCCSQCVRPSHGHGQSGRLVLRVPRNRAESESQCAGSQMSPPRDLQGTRLWPRPQRPQSLRRCSARHVGHLQPRLCLEPPLRTDQVDHLWLGTRIDRLDRRTQLEEHPVCLCLSSRKGLSPTVLPQSLSLVCIAPACQPIESPVQRK